MSKLTIPNRSGSAGVRAISDCGCLVLTRWDFLGVVRSHVDVALSKPPALIHRLSRCEKQLLS